MKKFNYLSERLKSSPLSYDPSNNAGAIKPIKETPMPAPLPNTQAPAPVPGPMPAPGLNNPMMPPPQTNLNAVPNENKVPQNLSRITKFQKLDRFPRIYKLIKS